MNANGADWKEVKLGSILRYLDERLTMDDEKEYLTITVKRRHGGLEIREKLFGHQIATKKQFRLVPGAFIISRVQCWHQAYAIVGDVPANTIASTNYDQFTISPEVEPRFFWWLSHSPAFTETVRSSAVGVVIEKMVFNRDQWLTKSVRLPPLAEQRRVVARIDELAAQIHEARILRHQTTDEAEALVRSRTTEIVSQNLKSHLWRSGTLVDFASSNRHAIKRGPFGSHLRKEFFVPSGYKVYEQKHAIYADFNAGSYYVDEAKFTEMKSFQVRPGDLIISCSGTIGRVAIVPDDAKPGIINQALLKITLDNSKIERRFFKTVFESEFVVREIEKISPGSAMKNIGSVKILKQINFPFPELDEQRRFLHELDALQAEVDALKRLQAETAAELDALLPAILDKAFKGEL